MYTYTHIMYMHAYITSMYMHQMYIDMYNIYVLFHIDIYVCICLFFCSILVKFF